MLSTISIPRSQAAEVAQYHHRYSATTWKGATTNNHNQDHVTGKLNALMQGNGRSQRLKNLILSLRL
jgi:hypothetical protein